MGSRHRAAPADSLFLTAQCVELTETLRMGWKSPSQPRGSRPVGPRREGRFAGCGYRCRKDLRTSEFTELVQTEPPSVPQPAPRPATSGVPTEPGGSPCRPGARLRPYTALHTALECAGKQCDSERPVPGKSGKCGLHAGAPLLFAQQPQQMLCCQGPWAVGERSHCRGWWVWEGHTKADPAHGLRRTLGWFRGQRQLGEVFRGHQARDHRPLRSFSEEPGMI